ncbi:tRNA (adenosine(37)-N6)-dimethylallyltransferase MiaA [Candidatus Latescibacterota bacterium]
MDEREPAKVLVIAGPTASGKKQIAQNIARCWGGEIVSADSRKVYRGLDIGTAKPSAVSRKEVPYHLIDIVDIDESFNAGDWVDRTYEAVKTILAAGKLPILSGGTGFYLKAFMEGLSGGIEPGEGIRERLKEELATLGPVALYRDLATVDPVRAARLHVNDTVRVMRALEIYRTTGLTFTALGERNPPHGHRFDYCLIAVTRGREELYRRVNRRVDEMIAAGLEGEVRAILDRGISRDVRALDTVGYREWFACFDGGRSREDTIALIKKNSRRYAKRQLTWFGAQPGYNWYNLDEPGARECFEENIAKWLGISGGNK